MWSPDQQQQHLLGVQVPQTSCTSGAARCPSLRTTGLGYVRPGRKQGRLPSGGGLLDAPWRMGRASGGAGKDTSDGAEAGRCGSLRCVSGSGAAGLPGGGAHEEERK